MPNLKIKVTAKVGEQVVSLSRFKEKLRTMDSILNDYVSSAAKEIKDMIDIVAVKATNNPETAMIEFKSYFDSIKNTNDIKDASPTTSPLKDISDHDKEQDALIGTVTTVNGGEITLGELPQFWDYGVIDLDKPRGGDRTPDSPGDKSHMYGHRANKHVVDHVLCHLTGYNTYEKKGGKHKSLRLRDYIEGRDVILFAVMYAAADIQRELKKHILEEFK